MKNFIDLVLFGMQGSGKGTQGKFLAKKFHVSLFETGAELRKLAKEKSALGGKIKTLIEKGHLVPNEVVMEMIENFLQKNPQGQGVIFDGIPRKKEQAESFNTLMKKLHRNFLGIFIEISEKEAMKRLGGRRICEQCHTVYPAWYKKTQCEKCEGKLITRTDDTMKSIKNRIEAYKKETLPVIDEYYAQGKLIKINGEQSIEGVQKEISLKLDER